MGGARPRRTIVISPATGPAWAARPTAPSLPTAALLRPWWPLPTRRVTAWRAPVSAREVCVCVRVWTGASSPVTEDLSRSALIPPAAILSLMIHTEMLLGRLAAPPSVHVAPVVLHAAALSCPGFRSSPLCFVPALGLLLGNNRPIPSARKPFLVFYQLLPLLTTKPSCFGSLHLLGSSANLCPLLLQVKACPTGTGQAVPSPRMAVQSAHTAWGTRGPPGQHANPEARTRPPTGETPAQTVRPRRGFFNNNVLKKLQIL